MSTNLSNISKLTLTDTFYNWYLKTNQIIDFIGPLNVYDVFVSDGLTATRSGDGPYTIEISLKTNSSLYAIDTKANTDGTSDIILNIGDLAQIYEVTDNTIFAVSQNTSGSTINKIAASDILPLNISGNHNFNGEISVDGLSVESGLIYLDSSNPSTPIGLYGTGTGDDANWYYDTGINAWISSENLGVKANKHIVSSNSGNAIFSFYADPVTNSGIVDLRLETDDGSDSSYWSIKTNAANLPYTLSLGHFTNGSLDEAPLQLEVGGSNGNNITRVNGTIEISDILNSEPFTLNPVANNVPITDSNGFLGKFVNRIKVNRGLSNVGDFVWIAQQTNGDAFLIPTSASSTAFTRTVGIVESVSGSTATVVTTGEFTKTGAGFTPGQLYYLSNTSGQISTTPGSISKPVCIGLTSNTALLFPDLASGSGGITNAFSAISIQGEGTYSSSGATTLTLKQGTGINLTLNTNNQLEIAATSGLPTASTYSVYNTNASATTPTTTAINSFSILGRPLSGNLSSITVNPGSILGRRDDTNDNDNPVESISFTQLRSFMGFSGSAYFDTFNFRDSAGTIVKTFSASSNQTVNIRAGSNITFTESGNTVYIASSGDFTNGDGGSTPLTISAGESSFSDVTSIDFSDSQDETSDRKKYIKFKPVTGLPAGSSGLYAVPGSDFMRFKGNSGELGFTEGNGTNQTLLEIVGSSTGITTSLTGGPKFTVSLLPTISVDKIKPVASNSIIISGTTGGRDTLELSDNSSSTSKIKINAYDTDLSGITNRINAPSTTHCVSIFADDPINTDEDFPTYPFKFHKIIVKDLQVDGTATFAESFKQNFFASKISGDKDINTDLEHPSLSSETIGYINFYNNRADSETSGCKGFSFQFVDGNEGFAGGVGTKTNVASILHPDTDLPGFTSTNYRKSLIISDKISFANLNGPGSSITPTPTIGWNNLDGGIFVKSTGQKSFIKFENDDTTDDFGNVGVRNGYSFLTYGNNVTLKLNANPILYGVSSLTLTTTGGEGTTDPTSGLKFEVETYNSSSDGKVAVIDEVTGGLAKVRFKNIIKELSAAASDDPIGTIYYSLT